MFACRENRKRCIEKQHLFNEASDEFVFNVNTKDLDSEDDLLSNDEDENHDHFGISPIDWDELDSTWGLGIHYDTFFNNKFFP